MEYIPPSNKEATLYLDIDGVIFPRYDLLSETEYSETLNNGLSREWVTPIEFYHPEVVAALGRVAANTLVILSSSRMMNFLYEPKYAEVVKSLEIQGALFIDKVRPGNVDIKREAVYRHWSRLDWADPGAIDRYSGRRGNVYTKHGEPIMPAGNRAVWVDDHINCLSRAHRKWLMESAERFNISTVMPNTALGLTLEDVATIE